MEALKNLYFARCSSDELFDLPVLETKPNQNASNTKKDVY